jgi:peroxiredoxin
MTWRHNHKEKMDMSTPRQWLDRGERAPDFVLPCQDGTPTRFYAKAGGRPTLLLFYDADASEQLRHFAEVLYSYAADTVALMAVRRDPATKLQQRASECEPLFPVFTDTQGTVRAAYHLDVTDKTRLFVLDPNLRLLASLGLRQDAGATVHQVMACLHAALPRVDPVEITSQAPVLLIPSVLDLATCHGLLHVWETQGNEATGIEHSRGTQREATLSPEFKRRRDHVMQDVGIEMQRAQR